MKAIKVLFVQRYFAITANHVCSLYFFVPVYVLTRPFPLHELNGTVDTRGFILTVQSLAGHP